MKLVKHSWILLVFGIIVISVLFGAFNNPPQEKQLEKSGQILIQPSMSPTSFTTAFAIFTNGTFRIFSDTKYHNLSAEVFLESPNVNTIQVRNGNITYQDFFNTLPMTLTPKCLTTGTGQTFCDGEKNKLRFFINGIENPLALEKIIQPNDQLLVTFGDLTDTQIKSQISQIPN